MKNPARKEYSNGEITVIWQAPLCMHSEKCFRGLPQVFDPSERPWIHMSGATTEQIKNQVAQCPSGALTYHLRTSVDEGAMD